VLQPLVENAVKHGVAPRAAGGDVTITARIETDAAGVRQLAVRIQDTGAGVSIEMLRSGREQGVGLRNVERRLQGQYGVAASLSIDSAPGSGTRVEVRIPIAPGARDQSAERIAV
jgi:sensor histidine kinase YesM